MRHVETPLGSAPVQEGSWWSLERALAGKALRERTREIEKPPPVLTKADFSRRYKAGEFGNASPTWQTLEEFHGRDSQFRLDGQLFHLRSKIPGGETFYNLSGMATLVKWAALGDSARKQWYVSAMAPESRKVLQGEILLIDPANNPHYFGMETSGIYLYYNLHPLPMREGMAKELAEPGYQKRMHAEGTKARMILLQYLCPNSLDWLSVLLDRYPDHAIEFSTYECEWGTVPGFNTIWWEVRRY